ncbi:hypothetical protein BV898_18631 [Hypsibius exemplaris]|uniref:Uncharacterized protein n=1 Tax=Hypsibius exemplaris TaxID=2072580 RepID=A0A9X6NHY4_HYPEX|nr:hypothetical protein BV898_18631 [Hypsibius exemplaris]
MNPTRPSPSDKHDLSGTNRRSKSDLFICHAPVLRWTGFLPLGRGSSTETCARKFTSYALTCLAVALLMGNVSYSFVAVSRMLGEVFAQTTSHTPGKLSFTDQGSINKTVNGSWLRTLLYYVPDLTAAARSFIVLAIILYKRNRWTNLQQHTLELVKACFPGDSDIEIRLYRKVKWISMASLVATVLSYLYWTAVSWVDNIRASNLTSLDAEVVFYPIPLSLTLRQYVELDAVLRTFPFILSQQAHLCGVFLVVILSETLTGFHREIAQASVDVTIEKVQRWLRLHVRMLDFVEEVSEMFQLIFLTTYVSDFLNVIGSLAFLLSSELITSDWSYLHYIGTSCIFGVYATTSVVPLIRVHEKGASLPEAAFRLAVMTGKDQNEQMTTPDLSYALLDKALRRFEKSCRHHPLMFTGLNYVHFTRELLFGTWALTVSFLILANELFK